MIDIKNLTFGYRSKQTVLQNLTLKLAPAIFTACLAAMARANQACYIIYAVCCSPKAVNAW
jgi:ABC-type multidrug transport system fused ATPase/permease subunit